MSAIESIVVVGSSGAGKTTVVNGLRSGAVADRLVIPTRFTTRRERLNDDLRENTILEKWMFWEKVATHEIDIFWGRDVGHGQRERYGFKRPESIGKLVVYSANNSFLKAQAKGVREVLERSAVIVVQADVAVREARLRLRSPDMSDTEMAHRLQSEPQLDAIPAWVPVHPVHTDELGIERAQMAVTQLASQYMLTA